jgi:hypothetical protein
MQWEDFGEFSLGEDDLTCAGRELRSEVNSGHVEKEVPDGKSQWGEPDEDIQKRGNENTISATKTIIRAFDQWRSDTNRDSSLTIAGMTNFNMTKVVSA